MMKSQYSRIAAYGLVLKSNRLLLCRISAALPGWEGYWTLPGGGIEFGEHPEAAMIREVEEETGLVVSAKAIVAIDSLVDESQAEQFHGIRIIYETELQGGELRNEIDGTTDACRYCSHSDIKEMKLVDLASVGVQIAFGN